MAASPISAVLGSRPFVTQLNEPDPIDTIRDLSAKVDAMVIALKRPDSAIETFTDLINEFAAQPHSTHLETSQEAVDFLLLCATKIGSLPGTKAIINSNKASEEGVNRAYLSIGRFHLHNPDKGDDLKQLLLPDINPESTLYQEQKKVLDALQSGLVPLNQCLLTESVALQLLNIASHIHQHFPGLMNAHIATLAVLCNAQDRLKKAFSREVLALAKNPSPLLVRSQGKL